MLKVNTHEIQKIGGITLEIDYSLQCGAHVSEHMFINGKDQLDDQPEHQIHNIYSHSS